MPRTLYPRALGSTRPRFKLLTDDTVLGVQALDPVITVNGQSVEPVFRYNGKDAGSTWSPWGYGEDLTLQAGSPTYNAGSPLSGALDDSVKPDSSSYWQAGNGSFADIGTEDFIFEAIFKTPPSPSGQRFYWKGATSGAAFEIFFIVTGVFYVRIYDGTNVVDFTISGLQGAQWNHLSVESSVGQL